MKKVLILFIGVLLLPAALCAAEEADAKPFDRGVGKMNSVFIPKGYIGGSLSVSYKTYNLGQSDGDLGYSMLFSLLSGIKGDMHTFKEPPYFFFSQHIFHKIFII